MSYNQDKAKAYYQKNKERLKAYAKAYAKANRLKMKEKDIAGYRLARKKQKKSRKNRILQSVNDYKSNHPCIYCGETDIRLLQFHHKDPSQKVGGVAQLARRDSVTRLWAEVSKCVVACVVCHIKLHATNDE